MALDVNETLDIVSLPHGKIFIGCKWFFTMKLTQMALLLN